MDLIAYPQLNFGVLADRLADFGIDIDKRPAGSIAEIYSRLNIDPKDDGSVTFIIGFICNTQHVIELINLQIPVLRAYPYMDTAYLLIRGTAVELTQFAIKMSQSKVKSVRTYGNRLSHIVSNGIDKTAFSAYRKNDLGDGTYSWRA